MLSQKYGDAPKLPSSDAGAFCTEKKHEHRISLFCTGQPRRVFPDIRFLTLALFLALCLLAVPAAAASEYFPSGGDGSADNPFRIATPLDLWNLSVLTNTNATYNGGVPYATLNYTVINDLNLSELNAIQPEGYNVTEGWVPIGTSSVKFSGSLNGGSHTISNLFINRSVNFRGMFGYIIGGNISNVTLLNVNVTGSSYNVAGLVGYLNGGSVSNSYATGNVTGAAYVGGLVGYVDIGGSVSNSYATGTVTGSGSYVGGLIGSMYGSSVSNSFAAGTVTGSNYVGGLVGEVNSGGSVSNSYATGSVTGSINYVGGLVGYHYSGSVSNSFALTRYVNGSSSVSRVMGQNISGTITNVSAWQGMSENGGTAFNTTADLYGENVTSAEVWNTYGSSAVWASFSPDIWTQGTAENYQLPVLKNLAAPDADASYLIPTATYHTGITNVTDIIPDAGFPYTLKSPDAVGNISYDSTRYTFSGYWDVRWENGTTETYLPGAVFSKAVFAVGGNPQIFPNLTAIAYHVTYSGENGSTVTEPVAGYPYHVNTTENLGISYDTVNYTFGGWDAVWQTGSTGFYHPGDTLNLTDFTAGGNLTLSLSADASGSGGGSGGGGSGGSGSLIPKNYTVTYKADGATNGVTDTTVEVPYNSTHIIRSNTAAGILNTSGIFAGWQTVSVNEGTPVAAGTTLTITGDLTLTPVWTDIPQFVITYNNTDSGQAWSEAVPVTTTAYPVKGLTDANLTSFTTPYAKAFDHWQNGTTIYSPGDTLNISELYTADTLSLTLDAVWTDNSANTVTITYTAPAGSSVVRTIPSFPYAVESPAAISLACDPVNYTADGWTTNADGTGTFYAIGADLPYALFETAGSNLNLYVSLTPKDFTIMYTADGATSGTAVNVSVPYGSQHPVLANTDVNILNMSGEFAGWTDGVTVYQPGDNLTVLGNLTLVPVWDALSPLPPGGMKSFTIAYRNGDQIWSEAVPVTAVSYIVKGPDDPNLAFFTAPAGKAFDHWQSGTVAYEAGAVIDVAALSSVQDSLVLDAVWDSSRDTGNVTVMYRNGDQVWSEEVPASVTDYPVKDVTDPNLAFFTVPAGKVFDHWQSGSLTYQAGETLDLLTWSLDSDEDVLLLDAVWKSSPPSSPPSGSDTIQVRFAANGGVPAPAMQALPGPAPVTEPAAMTKAGAVFTGWFADAGLTQLWDFRDTVSSDMTLYAGWKMTDGSSGGSSGGSGGSSSGGSGDGLENGSGGSSGGNSSGDGSASGGVPPGDGSAGVSSGSGSASGTGPADGLSSGSSGSGADSSSTGTTDESSYAHSPVYGLAVLAAIVLAGLLVVLVFLRHTVEFLTASEKYVVRVWHGRAVRRDQLPDEILNRTWYREDGRVWNMNEKIMKNLKLRTN